jgi:hypothetical protein
VHQPQRKACTSGFRRSFDEVARIVNDRADSGPLVRLKGRKPGIVQVDKTIVADE